MVWLDPGLNHGLLDYWKTLYPLGQMSWEFANGPEDRGSISGRVIPKTLKMVLDNSFLNTQQYKERIKGKVEQFRERSSALPQHLDVVAIENGAFWSSSAKVANKSSCTNNMHNILNNHDRRLLDESNRNSWGPDEVSCNCRRKKESPLGGWCNLKNVIYQACITPWWVPKDFFRRVRRAPLIEGFNVKEVNIWR